MRDLLDQGVPGEVIRLVMLSTHYRKPMDWTEKKRAEAEATLRKWREVTAGERAAGQVPSPALLEALSSDLNTHQAISVLHRLFRNTTQRKLPVGRFLDAAQFVGLLEDEHGEWFKPSVGAVVGTSSEMNRAYTDVAGSIVDMWQDLRVQKAFGEADELKRKAGAAGLNLVITEHGPSFELSDDFDPSKLESLK